MPDDTQQNPLGPVAAALGTGQPLGLALPQTLQARLAAALAQQKEGYDTSPIRSPWQGLARIANAMSGGYGQYQAEQQAYNLPQRVSVGNGSVMMTPTGHVIPNSFVSNTAIHDVEANGVKAPMVLRGVEGGGYQSVPIQQGGGPAPPAMPQAGGPPVRAGGPPAPAGGAVAGSSAGPMPSTTEGIIDWGHQQGIKFEGAKERAKKDETILANITEEGAKSQQKLEQMKQFMQVAKRAGYGVNDELRVWLGQHGIPTKGYSEDQLYKSMISFMAPELRPEGSGRIMGQEYEGFKQSLGNLVTTPAGREAAINYLINTHQWNVQAGGVANNMRGNPQQAFGSIMNIKLPQLDMSAIDKENAGYDAAKSGVPTATGPNGQKIYFRNGAWGP